MKIKVFFTFDRPDATFVEVEQYSVNEGLLLIETSNGDFSYVNKDHIIGFEVIHAN